MSNLSLVMKLQKNIKYINTYVGRISSTEVYEGDIEFVFTDGEKIKIPTKGLFKMKE